MVTNAAGEPATAIIEGLNIESVVGDALDMSIRLNASIAQSTPLRIGELSEKD